LAIDAGGGVDWIQAIGLLNTTFTARGGSDAVSDSLTVDDRTLPVNMSGGFVYADRFRRSADWSTQSNVYYSGFTAVDWYQKNNQNLISVYGVSPDISPNSQFYIGGGTADDYVEMYPFDASGNPTILANVWFNGGDGPDTLRMFNNGTAAGTYRAFSQFGSNDLFIDGSGNRWTNANTTVENVALYGGGGPDTFAVEQLKSGAALRLYGGGNNDTCTIGNGDMSANLTNASAFSFDGQSGSDRFTIANGVTNTAWTYRVQSSYIESSNAGGYFWHSDLAGIESQFIFSGSSTDTFFVDAVAPGVYTELRGGSSLKALVMQNSTRDLRSIQGKVAFYPGATGGYMILDNRSDPTADIVHQTATSIGAFLGDNLFGAGGSLVFNNIVNNGSNAGVVMTLGLGANTAYAQPLASSAVLINSHTVFTSASGSINLALAGVTNPVINGNAASGSLTSSNRQTLAWNQFAGAIQTDALAPTLVAADINVNGIPNAFAAGAANRQSLDVRFSEDVSGLLDTSWLVLNNLTTGGAIQQTSMAVTYNAGTNTARFTFPGLPNGVLPDGNYSGRVLAGLPDSFGNGLAADATFSFFFLMADANHDRSVDLTDFTFLAANFNQSGRTFSQGDFNYDGTVDLTDFTFLAGNFNKTLAPAAANAPSASADFDAMKSNSDSEEI
jgi:hypothetical protein